MKLPKFVKRIRDKRRQRLIKELNVGDIVIKHYEDSHFHWRGEKWEVIDINRETGRMMLAGETTTDTPKTVWWW